MLNTKTPITIIPMMKTVMKEYPSKELSSHVEVVTNVDTSAKFMHWESLSLSSKLLGTHKSYCLT